MRTLLQKTIDEINKDIHWSRKAVAINIYHNSCLVSQPRHSFADTARDLNVSRAYVSEMIMLINKLADHAELMNMSRSKALIYMRK